MAHSRTLGLLILLGSAACTSADTPRPAPASRAASQPSKLAPTSAPSKQRVFGEGTEQAPPPAPGLAVATFAGGCFWCMEPPFEKMEGVKAVWSGYTGGGETAPTYSQVSSGATGHLEAVRVEYDPDFVTYEELLDTFWRNVDPTDDGGQFVDRGTQYQTGIFVHDDAQRAAAEASKASQEASKRFGKPIVVPIREAGPFWLAEDYHQDFYRKKPDHYQRYRRGSGRDRYIEGVWGRSEH